MIESKLIAETIFIVIIGCMATYGFLFSVFLLHDIALDLKKELIKNRPYILGKNESVPQLIAGVLLSFVVAIATGLIIYFTLIKSFISLIW